MKVLAKNDKLIEDFINDSRYEISKEGFITRNGRKLGFTKKYEGVARHKAYMYIGYKGKELKVHRIVYRKFKGILDKTLVVHHVDGDSFNNNIDNLDLTTQEINMAEKFFKKSA